MIQSTYHDIIVKVDKAVVDEIQMGTQKLYLAGDYDIYKNTKITAEVVSVPKKLKEVVLYGELDGFPMPHGKKDKKGKYYPTTHQREYVTMKNQPIEIQAGDTIYFHYLTLSAHNFLQYDEDGMELYRCPYDQVFCYVRDGKVVMINGWMCVSPLKDDSYMEVEIDELDILNKKVGTRKLGVKMTDSGIIYDTNDKPVFRHGTVAIRGTAPDNKEYPIKEGTVIVYSDFSEFKNTIEGEEYYLMRLYDCVAYYEGERLIPAGDHVMMDVSEKKSSLIIIPDKYKRKNDEGTVIAVGNFVKELEMGDNVRFNDKEAYFVPIGDKDYCFIKQDYIWGKEIQHYLEVR